MPPIDSNLSFLTRAPLSEGTIKKSFDTAEQCEAMRDAAIKKADKNLVSVDLKTHNPMPDFDFSKMYLCVATDDSRLKGNEVR